MDVDTVSNIDDLLMGGQGNTQQPPTPEYTDGPAEVLEDTPELPDYGNDEKQDDHTNEVDESGDTEDTPQEDHTKHVDEYGNETENMTEGMKKRLKKQADKYENRIQELESKIAQLTPQQHQQLEQAAQNFKADPNSEDDFQRQFEEMVEQTVTNMQTKKQLEAQRAEEFRAQQEFERKLFTGMDRFGDFPDVIQSVGCEISHHMTNATRSLEDPAAFLYAAAKRHPEELRRISQLRDPYAQVREMGNLEARMRKGKSTTSAPRALGRTKEDAQVPVTKGKKEETIEDLIAKNDAKRLAQVRQRRGR